MTDAVIGEWVTIISSAPSRRQVESALRTYTPDPDANVQIWPLVAPAPVALPVEDDGVPF